MASPHGGSAKRPVQPPKSLLECCVCGEERPWVENELGSVPLPLNGTWWSMHLRNGQPALTCSPTCRVFGGLEPGPFDELE